MKYFVGRYSQTPRSEGSEATFLKAAKSEPLTMQNIPSGLFQKLTLPKKKRTISPSPPQKGEKKKKERRISKFRPFYFSKWKSFFKCIGVCVRVCFKEQRLSVCKPKQELSSAVPFQNGKELSGKGDRVSSWQGTCKHLHE